MAMTLDNFIKLYKNIPTDFDGYYGVQCMDLMHFYTYICLDIYDKSVLSAPTANLLWKLDYPQLFKKIPNVWNDLTRIPKRGSIIVWGTKVGWAGHVAMVDWADGMSIRSFDANFPTGSYPRLVNHSYYGVLGWFEPLKKI